VSEPLMEFKREHRDIMTAIESQGWSVIVTPKNHLRFESPTGRRVFHSGTSSDWRSILNLKAQLRRAGLTIGRR
jgi:predicted alpha/beta-fold hydrolase